MIIMRGDENPQRPLESDPGSPRRSTGNGKFREFLEGGGKFGGDWKRVLCAGMGARNERKLQCGDFAKAAAAGDHFDRIDRKSTRLNSSHGYISYAVFCLKKKITHPLVLNLLLRELSYPAAVSVETAHRSTLAVFLGMLQLLRWHQLLASGTDILDR